MKQKLTRKIGLLAVMLLTAIGNSFAFEVDGLTYRVVDNNVKTVKVTYQGSESYSNPYTQSSIEIPKTVDFNGNTYTVVEIGQDAFNMASLSSITIPTTVKTVGNGAFRNCSNLTTIDLSTVENFGNEIFVMCTNLTSVKLPETLQSIPDRMFIDCSSLTSFDFSEKITSIGFGAFSGTGLTSVTTSCNNINQNAFARCPNLTKVTLMANYLTNVDNQFFGSDNIETIICFVRNTGNYGFSDNVKEKATVIVPQSQVSSWNSSGFLNVKAADITNVGGHVVDVGPTGASMSIFINGKSSDVMYGGAYIVEPGTDVVVKFGFSDPVAELASFTINGTDYISSVVDNKYTIKNISGNQLIEATWKQGASYNLSIWYDQMKGNVLVNGNQIYGGMQPYPANKDITMLLKPNDGYGISYFSINSEDKKKQLTDNGDGTFSYTFNLQAETNVSIGFEKKYELTVTYNDGGTVTLGGENVASGTTKELTGKMVDVKIIPASGYELASVLYNGTDATSWGYIGTDGILQIYPAPDQGDNQTLDITFQNVKSSELTDEQGIIFKQRKSTDNSSYYVVMGHSDELKSEIVIPAEIEGCPVTSIESEAFRGCGSLTSITIPSSVTTIGYSAFWECSSLRLVTSKISNPFDVNAFDWSSTNATLVVPKDSRSAYKSVNGWTFGFILEESETSYEIEKTDDQGVRYSLRQADDNSFYYAVTGYSDDLKSEIVIPADLDGCPVKAIEYNDMAKGAFNDCNTLTSVILGNQLTTIGDMAFCGCENLISVKMGKNVRSIGNFAFNGCTSLTSITLSKKLESIGNNAFGSITWVSYCPITSITIPSSVKTIGSGAFQGCHDLALVSFEVDEDGETSLISIGDYAFRECSFTSITIPNSVTKIGSGVFANNQKLSTAILGNGITEIKDATFQNCSSLASFTIPEGVTSIGNNAFQMCWSLRSVKLPESVTSIGEYVFDGCRMKSIELPNSITEIPANLFKNNDLGYIKLGNNVQKIGKNAFGSTIEGNDGTIVIEIGTSTPPAIASDAFPNLVGMLSVINVIVPDEASQTAYGKASVWKEMTFANMETNVELTVDQQGNIGRELYDDCKVMPAKVVGLKVKGSINAVDFQQMRSNFKSLLRLDLSECDITEIPDWAMTGKTQLQELTLPTKLQAIGRSAFQGCPYLTGKLQLPSGVTSIGNSAFEGTAYTSVTLPLKLQTIGDSAFYNLPIKQNLNLPDALTKIGDYAFADTQVSGHADIPKGITYLGAGAFRNTQIIYFSPTDNPNGITSISWGLLQGCSKLDYIYIPQNITEVSAYAFDGCRDLSYVRMSPNLVTMGEYAFQNTQVEYLKVPSKVEILSQGVLKNCKSLESLSLPANLKTVSPEALYGCSALCNLSIEAIEPPTAERNSFLGVNTDLCLISIPTQSFYNYLEADYWGQFVMLRNDIAVETEGNGEIAFESVEEGEEGSEALTRGQRFAAARAKTRAAGNDDEGDMQMTFANNGSSILIPQGKKVRFIIIPGEGEELLSATLDGVDIMPNIVDGVYTATADKKNAKLVVKFGTGQEQSSDANAIESLTADTTNGAWYTLSGQKLDGEPTAPGVYVKDGKKIYVK